jgi:cysteine synthase B
VILAKLEGNNPAGSVKDRPALSMIVHAERAAASSRATR